MTEPDRHPARTARRGDTPYGTAEVTLAVLRGGRPLLQVGHHPGLMAHAADLGCPLVALVGDPESHELVRAAGHEAHLVDLEDIDAVTPLGDRTFDQMVALHVVDVVADPVSLLGGLAKRLTPQGELVLSVRNAAHVDAALSVLLGRSPGEPLGDAAGGPAHLYDWHGVEHLLGSAGLSIVDVVEVHRAPALDAVPAGAVPAAAIDALVEHASTVFEWVVVASPAPRQPSPTAMRHWLDDAIERAAVIDAASAYARSLEERLAATEAEAAQTAERLRAELDDALRLEREVEWQREVITTLTARLDQAERRMPEVEQAYANAMTLATATEAELRATRERVGFVLMDGVAQRAVRHRLLNALLVTPLRVIVRGRTAKGPGSGG